MRTVGYGEEGSREGTRIQGSGGGRRWPEASVAREDPSLAEDKQACLGHCVRARQSGLPGALCEGHGTWPEWLGGWEVGGRGFARSLPGRYLLVLWACTPLSHLRNN